MAFIARVLGVALVTTARCLRFTVTFRLALALEEPITVPPAVSAHAIGFVASGFLDDIWIPKKNSYPIRWRDVPTAPASPH